MYSRPEGITPAFPQFSGSERPLFRGCLTSTALTNPSTLTCRPLLMPFPPVNTLLCYQVTLCTYPRVKFHSLFPGTFPNSCIFPSWRKFCCHTSRGYFTHTPTRPAPKCSFSPGGGFLNADSWGLCIQRRCWHGVKTSSATWLPES